MCCYIKHACKTQLCWASCRWWYQEHFLTITPCAQDTVILLLCKNNQNISLIQVSLLTIQLQYGTTVLTCGLIISTNTIWPWLTNCTDLEKGNKQECHEGPKLLTWEHIKRDSLRCFNVELSFQRFNRHLLCTIYQESLSRCTSYIKWTRRLFHLVPYSEESWV